MDKRLGRFELLEQIEVGGYTTVYRAVEDMGEGIHRPTAVKVLQAWNLDDEEQLSRLKREASMLVEISEAPNIVSVHGMGIDAEMGPWIAMELAGRSLKYAIEDGPTEPNNVRVMLRDVLHALRWVHGVEPPILHRDLKPQNILSTGPGLWKVADFGLAKRAGAEETMQLATVKYAAPELLDSTLGEESPKVDIYALGVIAYEMALGRTLFRKQFPSVYDPTRGSKESEEDDRPKWMYWHTSMQMTLPPLSELIEGYPKDLSDLVAGMIAKSAAERIGSADEALAELGEVTVAKSTLPVEDKEEDKKSESSVAPVIAGAALVAVLIAAVAGLLWFFSQGQPRIELDGEPLFVGNTSLVPVACRVVNPPDGAKVQVSIGRSGSKYFDLRRLEGSDRWEGAVRIDGITKVDGTLAIVSGRERLVRRSIQIERTPPDRVSLTIRAARNGRDSSPVEGATVTLRSSDGKIVQFEGQTNDRGEVVADVAYGPILIEATHPGYQAFVNTDARGEREPIRPKADGSSRLTIPLEPKSFAEVRSRMRSLTEELLRLAKLKTDCPDGVPEISDEERELIVEYCQELLALADGHAPTVNFVSRIKKVEDCDPDSVPPAPPLPVDPDLVASDPLALIAELTAEIDVLTWMKVNCTNPPDPELSVEEEARRQQLLTQLEEVMRASRVADSESLIWIRKMRSVGDCDPSSIPEKPPGAIGDNPYGDPESRLAESDAMARIAELTAEIEVLTWIKVNCKNPPEPELSVAEEARRQQLLTQLEEVMRASRLADSESLIWIRKMRDVADCDPSSIPEKPPGAIGDNPYSDAGAGRSGAGMGTASSVGRVPKDPEQLGALIDQLTADVEYLTWVKVNCSDPPNPEISEEDEARRRRLLDELENALRVSGLATGKALIWIQQMRDVEDCDPSSVPPGRPPIADPRRPRPEGAEADEQNPFADFGGGLDPNDPLGLGAPDAGREPSQQEAAKNRALSNPDPQLMLELRNMPLGEFAEYVRRRVPSGSVKVTTLTDRNDVRIEGPIFDSEEIHTVYVRLREAILIERIEDELRIDGWELARILRAAMAEQGAKGPRIDAWFSGADSTLFVQYLAGSMTPSQARSLAEGFVVNPGLLWLRGYEEEPIERPTRRIESDAVAGEE